MTTTGQTASDELLPCRFCGGKAELIDDCGPEIEHYKMASCFGEKDIVGDGPKYIGRDLYVSVEEWNTRPPQSRQQFAEDDAVEILSDAYIKNCLEEQNLAFAAVAAKAMRAAYKALLTAQERK